MGLGGFPAPHDQWLGMLGMHGTRTANYAMDEADLIIAIGARFDDRITGKLSEFAPRAKFIHIDIDPAEISKNVAAHIPIVGDAHNILPRLTAEYRALSADPARLEEWWARIRTWQERHPLGYQDSTTAEIKPQFMIQALYEATGGDAIVTSDVGQHQMWAAQYFHFAKPRRWINSGGLGTMGFGLPAAMGAKVGCPEETVVCIAGDGSIQMNMQELATCAAGGDRGQGVHHEQRLPGHGPPVAGAVLGQALQPSRYGSVARLRQGRRGLRRDRDPADRQAHAGRPTCAMRSRRRVRCWWTSASPARRTPIR